MTKPRPPRELGAAGKTLWRSIFNGLEADDPRELHAIRQACLLEDDITRLREQLADEELIVQGSTGQPVESPLLGAIRQATALQARLFGSVAVDDTTPSTAGRRLNQSRRDR